MRKPLEGRRILVVEDEFLIAMEMEDTLRNLGAEVVGPFARLEPAFAAIHREELHGAILDVKLDGETTDQVAAALVSRGIPVLLTTGFESEQLPSTLQELPRLGKPFDERALRDMIEQAYR
jgi:DNA-binding NtrC family response regulator